MTGPIVLEFTDDEIVESGLNDRGHWTDQRGARGASTAVKMVVAQRVRRLHAGRRLDRAVIEVSRRQTTHRRRDPDNLAATAKPMIDGLVEAGLLPDDSHKHVPTVVLTVCAGADTSGWTVTVTPVNQEVAP